jgi:hypothetical protein
MQTYFNSIASLIEAIETNQEKAKGTKIAYNRFFINGNDNFYTDWNGGIKDNKEFNEFLKNGYLPAVEELRGTATNDGSQFNLVAGVSGQFNDVDAYLTGQPECMAEFEQIEENKYLTLNISGVTPAEMKAEQIMKKCKAVFSAVNFLESNGTRVKILLTVCTFDKVGKKDCNVQVLIKDFTDNFVPTFHGLLIGHLATIRGIIYAYLSLYNKTKTLGSCREAQPEAGQKLISYFLHNEKQIKEILTN